MLQDRNVPHKIFENEISHERTWITHLTFAVIHQNENILWISFDCIFVVIRIKIDKRFSNILLQLLGINRKVIYLRNIFRK